MKTIAQQLNIKEFPFVIKDSQGKRIYYEDSDGFWCKIEYDSQGREIYRENSNWCWGKIEYDSNGNEIRYENIYGIITVKRPKPTCEGKTVEIDGIKYKLVKE
jgi:hypothetical protein